jgi:hypothetical protein
MHDFQKSLIDSTLRKVLKRLHYRLEVMLTCVRWYVAYPLSLHHIEEMMHERGVGVDHSTPQCSAGRSRCCPFWLAFSVGANAPWGEAGA